MKRHALAIICAIFSVIMCLSAIACNNPADANGESSAPTAESTPAPESTPVETPAETPDLRPHYHEFASTWSIDEKSHWYACSQCLVRKDEEPHDFELIHVNEEPTEDKAGRGIFICKDCCGGFELPIPPLTDETN